MIFFPNSMKKKFWNCFSTCLFTRILMYCNQKFSFYVKSIFQEEFSFFLNFKAMAPRSRLPLSPSMEARLSNSQDSLNSTGSNQELKTQLDSTLGKKHALKKYDKFALNTSCFWGGSALVVKFHEIFVKK